MFLSLLHPLKGWSLQQTRGGSERLETLYILAVHCGLREGELLALRWDDMDLEAAKPALLVRRTLTRGEDGRGYVVGASTKTGKGRRVRLTGGQLQHSRITANVKLRKG